MYHLSIKCMNLYSNIKWKIMIMIKYFYLWSLFFKTILQDMIYTHETWHMVCNCSQAMIGLLYTCVPYQN